MKKICVLMGGDSSERDISIQSGNAVVDALQALQWEVIIVDPVEPAFVDTLLTHNPDAVFIALHGGKGENGHIQSVLESMNIPFTGSGSIASSLAMDKEKSRNLFVQNAICVPKGWVIEEEVFKVINWAYAPFIAKPVDGGSSIGLHIVCNEEELNAVLKKQLHFDKKILVEQFISGKEITVGIFQGKALPVIEIQPANKLFDFYSKYTKGATNYVIPSMLEQSVQKTAQEIACKCHQILGCSCFSRVDLIYGQDKKYYVLEVNTIPGMTETSLLPKALQAIGISFQDMCRIMIEEAIKKTGIKKKQKTKAQRGRMQSENLERPCRGRSMYQPLVMKNKGKRFD